MDRRIRYTKMVLNESLLKFLDQKPLEKITVTAICKDADINRSTYYSHFTDPFDQFSQLKASILNELALFTENIDTQKLPDGQRQYKVLKSLLQYIENKRHVFQILLTKSGDYNLQHDLLVMLGEKAFPAHPVSAGNEIKNKYHLIYASNGCFGMFFEWLMDEDPISSDQLAHLMADFTRNIY